MYSVILVESDYMQRKILQKMIYSIYEPLNIYEADNKNSALEIIKKHDINMFIIDITLKDSSGLELAIYIRGISKYEFTQIIFLSTTLNYIMQAFKQIHCYDYILKPYNKTEVQVMLSKLINKEIRDLNKEKKISKKSMDKEFIIRIKNSIFVKVKIDEIFFIEVSGRDCEVNTFNRIYIYSNISLKKILTLIDCSNIVQSHKSFAVNKNYIFKVEKLDSRLNIIYFNKYRKTALLGYKFKNNIMSDFNE